MGQRLFYQESAMPTAHSSVMCYTYTKMLRILSIFMLHSAWDLLGKSKGKNVIMRVIWVFPLSGVCNFFSSCHWLTRKEEVSVLKWELTYRRLVFTLREEGEEEEEEVDTVVFQ